MIRIRDSYIVALLTQLLQSEQIVLELKFVEFTLPYKFKLSYISYVPTLGTLYVSSFFATNLQNTENKIKVIKRNAQLLNKLIIPIFFFFFIFFLPSTKHSLANRMLTCHTVRRVYRHLRCFQ